jgi:hypothetical protein
MRGMKIDWLTWMTVAAVYLKWGVSRLVQISRSQFLRWPGSRK